MAQVDQFVSITEAKTSSLISSATSNGGTRLWPLLGAGFPLPCC